MTEMDYRMALLALHEIDSALRFATKGSSKFEVKYAHDVHIPTKYGFDYVPSNLSSRPSIRQICVIKVTATLMLGDNRTASPTLELFYNAPDRINGDVIRFNTPSTWEDSVGKFLDLLIKTLSPDDKGSTRQTLASFR